MVAMSCSEDRPAEHAKLRSALITLVRQLQHEHCSSLEVCEFLISPSLVRQYSFDSLPDTDLFAIKHVAMSILLHKPTISNQSNEFINHLLTQSLPLEPYQLISPSSVCDLFDTKKADQPVPASLLQKVQEQICQFSRSSQVYKQLREDLDSMSIFAGRNPLEVAELKEEDIFSVSSPTTGACGHSSILSIADLDKVKTLLNNLVDWQSLGLKLGLLYPTLEKIEIDHRGMVEQCKTKMLAAWLR